MSTDVSVHSNMTKMDGNLHAVSIYFSMEGQCELALIVTDAAVLGVTVTLMLVLQWYIISTTRYHTGTTYITGTASARGVADWQGYGT